MKRGHFEKLAPVCPRCCAQKTQSYHLKLASVIREQDDCVEEGILHCSNPACQCEYPIIDAVPILVPDVRQFIANNIQTIWARRDLSAEIESLLGDCAGPGSAFDDSRLHLSIYVHSHYGDFDDDDQRNASGLTEIYKRGWRMAENVPPGPVLDAACSVGRTTMETARDFADRLILGVDLNFAMLQIAHRVLKDGVVRYDKRRVGLVYEHREFQTAFAGTANVDFWLCDVTQLPFADESFAAVTAFNALDCLTSPIQFLHHADRVIRPGGWFLASSPYDWSLTATPLDSWIGGHSQRAGDGGSAEQLLSQLLTPGAHPQSVRRLQLQATIDNLPWRVRLHDRFTAEYKVQLMAARASD